MTHVVVSDEPMLPSAWVRSRLMMRGIIYLSSGLLSHPPLAMRFHFLTSSLIAVVMPLLLGCATVPPSTTSATPAGEGKLSYPEKHFSVMRPPPNWEITRKYPRAVVAWEEKSTRSIIQISASNPSGLSYRVWAKTLITAFEGTLQERYPGRATAALTEEQEVNLNGQRFYQVIVNWHYSPTEGMQVTGKWLLYLLQREKFAYNLGLITVLGHFEQHRPIIEQMARSFAYVE
jgi:hypothetical protein